MKFIGRPKNRDDIYPWRPMDNRERRALWAAKYYSKYKPYGHENRL